MHTLNNIFKSFFFDNIYPNDTSKLKTILKSNMLPHIQYDREILVEDMDNLVYTEPLSELLEEADFMDDDNYLIIDTDYYNTHGILTVKSDNIEYHFKNGLLHNDLDEPAFIWSYNFGTNFIELYFKHGKIHREGDKPAYIEYNTSGEPEVTKYYKNDMLHRENGPAIITKDEESIHNEYYLNGNFIKSVVEQQDNSSDESLDSYESNGSDDESY